MSTREQWLKQVRDHAHLITKVIERYHPAMPPRPEHPANGVSMAFPITAPNAERATRILRDMIRRTYSGDPLRDFETALEAKDVHKLLSLMNQAWFGVPESVNCWSIVGFAQLVELLEEPPDEDE